MFEGEYIDGLKNEKGKEYKFNSGKLIFEGEYYNNDKKKEKHILKDYQNMKVNIYMIKNIMEKGLIKMEIYYMN